ncbi:MAG: hypothetical protein ACOYL7_02645 [Caldilinea sp.]
MNNNENASGLWIAQSSGLAKINDGEFWMEHSGEILLRGRQDESGTFVVEEIARIALGGWVVEVEENPFGRVTIAGPVGAVPTGGQRGNGEVTGLRLQVHYRQLTLAAIERGTYFPTETEAFTEAFTDAFIPPVVYMDGALQWEQQWEQVSGEDRAVGLSVKLFLWDDTASNSGRGVENLARTITFNDPLQLVFASVDEAQPDDSPDTVVESGVSYRLCTRPTSPCAAGATEMLIRRLPIRFHCLFAATEEERGELPGLCASQVAGSCEVWREQAILALQVETQGEGIVVTYAAETWEEFIDSGTAFSGLMAAAGAPSTIEIFLVREVKRQSGSSLPGIAYDITTANAGVVLALWALRDGGHRHLLAHELGHCLGLSDRGDRREVGGIVLPQGSKNSVMQMKGGHAPRRNTAANCELFGEDYPGLLNPLAGIVWPLRKDCLRPEL